MKKSILVALSVLVVLLIPLTVYAQGIIQYDGIDDNDDEEITTTQVSTTQPSVAEVSTTEPTSSQQSQIRQATTAGKEIVTTRQSKEISTAAVNSKGGLRSGEQESSTEPTSQESSSEESTTQPSTSPSQSVSEPALSQDEDAHYWEIYGFDIQLNDVYLACRHCGALTSVRFTSLAGTQPGAEGSISYAVDVNHDNMINGRDLAYLCTGFIHWMNDDREAASFDSQFFYVYITILFVILATVLCIVIRRNK